jgi:hypothetical protein
VQDLQSCTKSIKTLGAERASNHIMGLPNGDPFSSKQWINARAQRAPGFLHKCAKKLRLMRTYAKSPMLRIGP